jgi:hypothetical protein
MIISCFTHGSAAWAVRFRETGAVLNVAVEYSNMKAWGVPGDYVYVYSSQLVRGSAFKMTGTFYEPFRSKRVLVYAHGMLVQATVGGTAQVLGWLAAFSLPPSLPPSLQTCCATMASDLAARLVRCCV